MADTHETSADIIAEARDKYTVHNCQQCAWRKCCSKGFGSEECGKFRESIFLKLGIEDGYFTQLLDRLEAALKRELGDCAKLREALESLYDQICHGETEQHVAANRQMIRAALAANMPVFVKQLDIGGRCVTDINKFPAHLRIRQVPWAEEGGRV